MSAKRLMLEIARCCQRSRAATGDIEPEKIAELLERALRQPRPDFLLELAEYLGTAAEGTALDPASWKPLEHFPHLKP